MNKFFIKKMLWEKEERTKTMWSIALFIIGTLILYFNPLSAKEIWGSAGVLSLFISGHLIGSIPNQPKDPFNSDK